MVLRLYNGLKKSKDKYYLMTRGNDMKSDCSVHSEALLAHSYTRVHCWAAELGIMVGKAENISYLDLPEKFTDPSLVQYFFKL